MCCACAEFEISHTTIPSVGLAPCRCFMKRAAFRLIPKGYLSALTKVDLDT